MRGRSASARCSRSSRWSRTSRSSRTFRSAGRCRGSALSTPRRCTGAPKPYCTSSGSSSIRGDRCATCREPSSRWWRSPRRCSTKVNVLILDEPTASLTEKETQSLFALVDRLRRDAVGIIYVSHRMREIKQLADRITVLRDGRRVGTREARDVSEGELVEMMTGRKVDLLFPHIAHRQRQGRRRDRAVERRLRHGERKSTFARGRAR